jgi:hypothetical protein
MFRRTETYSIKEFMNKEHQYKDKKKKERKRANKAVLASASVIPLMAFTPATVASAAASCTPAVSVMSQQAVPAVGGAVGKELIAGLAHIFDPLIQLLIGVSFPVASALILFKLFMGFFVDQAQVWEGIGKVALVYILIQMFPVFSAILKQLGTLV